MSGAYCIIRYRKHNSFKNILKDRHSCRHTSANGFKATEVWLKGTMTVLIFSISPQQRHNKWIYPECKGEWINQQRCYIVWNATINHSGLMSGRGKGQWCKEQWGEDAPFVVIYYGANQLRPFWLYSSLKLISADSFLTLSNRNRAINMSTLVMGHTGWENWLYSTVGFWGVMIYIAEYMCVQFFNVSHLKYLRTRTIPSVSF